MPPRSGREAKSLSVMKCTSPFLLLIASFALLTGCDRGAGAKMAVPPPTPVQVAVAVRQDVPRVIESIGNVQSLRTVAIKSQVDGIIAEIHFREGDDVKAGDRLG